MVDFLHAYNRSEFGNFLGGNVKSLSTVNSHSVTPLVVSIAKKTFDRFNNSLESVRVIQTYLTKQLS